MINQTQSQIQTLELKPNHLQPQIQNYQTQTKSNSPDNKNISCSCLPGMWVCIEVISWWRSWVLGLWSWKSFVDRWVWVSCSFSVRNSLKKKNRSIVVVVVVLCLRLRKALSGSAFFAVSSYSTCTGVEVDRELMRRDILIF